MVVTPRLDIKQTQSLLMTPELRQAINLLQASNLELNELITKELENNPLLEREDDTEIQNNKLDEPEDTSDFSEEEPFSPDVDYDNEFDDFASDREGYDQASEHDWQDYAKSKNAVHDEGYDYFEKKLSDNKSLYKLIEEQISLKFTKKIDQVIAINLCEHLDGAGYFRGDCKDLAKKMKIDHKRIIQILNIMKTFEPSGLFAENLAECLKIQLQDQNRLDPIAISVLDNLDLIGQHKTRELLKICSIDQDDLNSVLSDIKSLNPKPAAAYDFDVTRYVIPDVFVKINKQGDFLVELNQMSLPRVLINKRYYNKINGSANSNKESQKYLKQQLGSASFLVRAMHQRAETILRVSEEIVKAQKKFLIYGIDFLKPMQLKDIAEAVEMHESTISRATTNKYMHTPRGLFELKYFFSGGADSTIGGNSTSTHSIKYKIKKLIEDETPDNILSDENLVELLTLQKIKIARRTVAKYRESLNIPTSAERKRKKRSGLNVV